MAEILQHIHIGCSVGNIYTLQNFSHLDSIKSKKMFYVICVY